MYGECECFVMQMLYVCVLCAHSSLGFKCPDCFIWNCSYIIYPSKLKGPFRDNCLGYYYLLLAFPMAGWVEGIRRALVLGLVLIAGTPIEQAPSIGPLHSLVVSLYRKSVVEEIDQVVWRCQLCLCLFSYI